jgi:Holliday junction resolvase RusA-like endonuclease
MLRTADVCIPVIPKSAPRPRFKGNAYNDPRYKAWKANFRAFVSEWWLLKPLNHVNLLCCHFYGPAVGDLDNKLKAVLDCLVGQVISDDNVKVVPFVVTRWFKSTKADAHIYLKVCWIEDEMS